MQPAPASILESWTVVLVLRSASLSMVAVANINETLPSLSFLSSSGFLAIVLETTKEDINITGSNIDAQQQLSLPVMLISSLVVSIVRLLAVKFEAMLVAKDINIKAGYNGSLNESYHKTSSFSLGGLE
jgi:hypothetical protein